MAAGREIKRLRENQPKKVSAEMAASLIGVDVERLRKWEQRDADPKDSEDIRKVEKYFGQSVSKLNLLENFQFYELKEDYLSLRRTIKNTTSGKRIPLYDAPAAGGITETDMTPIHAPSGTIDVGDLLHDCEAAIRIYGNSMLPGYPPGCVVGLNRVTSSFIEPGEIYVIETSDRRLLKRLFYPNDDPSSDSFLCLSDNSMLFEGGARHGKLAYPPFSIPKKEVHQLFQVTGVIKRNSNSVIINR